MNVLALLLTAAASGLWAHDYPIKPVGVTVRVEPDRVVADIRSDSIYWIEEVVGNESLSPAGWKSEELARAEKYTNEHLRLAADGRPLAGKLVWAEYVQRPWQVNEQGEVRLRMAYSSAWDASVLSGAADFFEDYRRERLEAKEPILPIMDFRTRLKIAGSSSAPFELKPGDFDFKVPVAQARSGPIRRFIESAAMGARRVLFFMEGWAALAGLALSLSARSTPAFIALLAGLAWPAAAPAIPAWTAGVAATLSAGRWTGEGTSPWLEAGALALLGAAWAGDANFWLPRAAPGVLERLGCGIGAALAAALALIAGLLAVTLERNRSRRASESGAATLFERRRRLAATVLLIVAACGLCGELFKRA